MLMLGFLALVVMFFKKQAAMAFAALAVAFGGGTVDVPARPDAPAPAVAFPTKTRCNERAPRGWLGVATMPNPAAEMYDSEAPGLLVTRVVDGTPAARIGLRPNDVLATLDGEPLQDPRHLRELVRSHKPGESVRLVWRRGPDELSAFVVLSATYRP